MNNNYFKKTTISMKMFISELGEDFSAHMRSRLMELEQRTILTRKQFNYVVDLKHVEHVKYECACTGDDDQQVCEKEYAYGQFAVIQGQLYFSESCIENERIEQAPVVRKIYDALDSKGMIVHEDLNYKKVDDSNIDFVVDSILSVCPQVSQAYLDIVEGMTERANNRYSK